MVTKDVSPLVMAQPWYVKGKTFGVLWAMLLLLICGGVATLFTRVPIHAQGVAVIVDGKTIPQYGHDGPVLVAFLPPETLPDLHVGRAVAYELEQNKPLQRGAITAVEDKPISAGVAEKEFNLSAGAGLALLPQSAVVLAHPELPAGVSLQNVANRTVRIKVEVGTRRVGAFVPLINRLFDEH